MRDLVVIAHPVTEGTLFLALKRVQPKHSVLSAIHVCLLVLLTECEDHLIHALVVDFAPLAYGHKSKADEGSCHD